jgi:hypothetical protein
LVGEGVAELVGVQAGHSGTRTTAAQDHAHPGIGGVHGPEPRRSE